MTFSWKVCARRLWLSVLIAAGALAQTNLPVVLSSTTLNLGNQPITSTSATQSVLLTNASGYPIFQSIFQLSGQNQADFSLTTSCGIYLEPGEQCALAVAFTPSSLGLETAQVLFTNRYSQLGLAYPQTITVSGTGVPATVPNDTTVNLPSLFFGGPSAVQTVTVTNAGRDPNYQGSFLVSGPNASDFILSTTCGTNFWAGTACSVSVLFTPASTRSETATLSYTDSDAYTGLQYTQTVALNGTLPTVPTGVLEIISKHSGKALDVLEASTADGAPIQQFDFLARSNQQWTLMQVEPGYYAIENVNSGKVLDVIEASTEDGAGVQQWAYLGSDNQKWQINPISDGSYQIVNKASGKLLDVTGLSMEDGTTMQQWSATGADNQKWMITAQQYFTVTSLNSGKVLDMTGYSLAEGALLQQWDSLGAANQQWQFIPLGNGYCEIVNRLSGKALEATTSAGSAVVDGALVQQDAFSGADNQQWQLNPVENGYYRIVNKSSGKVLDVIGLSVSDGAGIQVYTYLGGSNQLWHLDLVTP